MKNYIHVFFFCSAAWNFVYGESSNNAFDEHTFQPVEFGDNGSVCHECVDIGLCNFVSLSFCCR